VVKETPLDIIVLNTGDAAAHNVRLSASQPSGWSVEFQPQEVAVIPADSQAEVTAKIKPAEKAVAGDYEITVRAQPQEGLSESTDFRITGAHVHPVGHRRRRHHRCGRGHRGLGRDALWAPITEIVGGAHA
jgi:hypothetical protein